MSEQYWVACVCWLGVRVDLAMVMMLCCFVGFYDVIDRVCFRLLGTHVLYQSVDKPRSTPGDKILALGRGIEGGRVESVSQLDSSIVGIKLLNRLRF